MAEERGEEEEMSVIVKGMEMPKDCNKCPMTVDGYCRIIGYPNGDAIIKRYKPLWCPLVEIPPHGRLIDADALTKTISEHVYPVVDYFNSRDYGMFWTGGIEKAISEQPTIIEAEEMSMGTNYYAVRNRPTISEPIHIGKSSWGWKFLFRTHNDTWEEPPVVWNTYDQVYEWLYKHTVESNEFVIIDEYDQIVSFDEFFDMVEKKQSEDNPDNFRYGVRNENGYRFDEHEFC